MPDSNSNSDQMATPLEIYKDATETIRHYDGQRFEFFKVTLAALTVIASIYSYLQPRPGTLALLVFALVVSAIGILSNHKYAYLINLHRARASLAAQEIGRIQKFDPNKIHREAGDSLKDSVFRIIKMSSIVSTLYLSLSAIMVVLLLRRIS